MSPRTKFEKDEIVAAAFEIAREKGFAAITARSVAHALGCSVAPIYVNFETIEELTEAVVQRVFALSQEMLAREQGPHVFENIGRASLAFAREYPVFCRELVLNPNPHLAAYETVENALIEEMAYDPVMRDWSVEERRRLFLKMRAFQMGFTAMVANGQLPSWLDSRGAEELLMEVGAELMEIQTHKWEVEKL
jgi:AcrR family transcriptional regulator